MRWVNGLTDEERMRRNKEKDEQLQRWHKWFAWYPIVYSTKDGRKLKVWLESVERKGSFQFTPWDDWWTWEYRLLVQP